MIRPHRTLWALMLVAALPLTAAAQDRGPVTNLPLPRFVSLKSSEGYARRGPSRTHRIDWIFRRRDMPMEITAEHGHWRRVRDREGAGGWMHYSLLSGVRTVLIEQDMLQMHTSPDPKSLVAAQLELGVIARVEQCALAWCDLAVGGHHGWVPKSAIWGVGPDEILD
ncbi:MAG: SH3 domain-containing protein [Rhodobacterales bacterium]|nr:SH3 domain-containing protein [Rhodobacterales bacterium]